MRGHGHILVASDLSTGARYALARGLLLAAEQDVPLTVLHVADVPADFDPDLRERAAVRPAEAALRAAVESLVRRYRCERPVKVEVRVVAGRAFVQIIAESRAVGASLVVLGAHGAHAIRDLVVGTTAEKVLRKGDRPVLLVKRRPRGAYRRVLVAVDFSDGSSRTLGAARAVAPDAAVSVLHVCDVAIEGLLRRGGLSEREIARHRRACLRSGAAELEAFLQREGLARADRDGAAITPLVASGRPERVVTETARRRRADLVVVGTRGRSRLSHLLLGSVAEHVLRDTTCDVLAVRSEGVRFEMP